MPLPVTSAVCPRCGLRAPADQCDNCMLFVCRQCFFYFHHQGVIRCLCVLCNLATLDKLSADDLGQFVPFS